MYTYRIKSNKRTIYFCIMNPAYFSRHRACNPPAYSSRNILQRTSYVPAYFSRKSLSLHLDLHFSIYNMHCATLSLPGWPTGDYGTTAIAGRSTAIKSQSNGKRRATYGETPRKPLAMIWPLARHTPCAKGTLTCLRKPNGRK